MDADSALRRLASAAPHAARRPLRALTDEALNESVERYLNGEWDVRDLVEMHVDDVAVQELSTAASVGSGPDRGLGRYHPDEDKQLEKILSQLEGYKRRMGLSEVRPSTIRQFAAEYGLPESLTDRLVEYFRRRGDV